MTSKSIVTRFRFLRQSVQPNAERNLHHLAQNSRELPGFVRQSPVAMRYLDLLGPLAWSSFPERDLTLGQPLSPVPYAAFCVACLVKVDHQLRSMGALRRYLIEHPALVWLAGFPLVASRRYPWGFDAQACLPTQRHFTRLLRTMPNQPLQYLLDSSVNLIQTELAEVGLRLGECISLDTKHIIAWVKENNPKAYVQDRYNKTKQPKGDSDCRLGCKRRHNQRTSPADPPPTPTTEPLPASTISVGEYYWGYASGVVATKADGWGEFVLAELTQPFDQADVSYFFPLMTQVERRLERKPKFGALDAAFDAFYVHEYFHQAGGFAAVPWADRQDHRKQFDHDGRPLCAAGFGMPLKSTFMKKSRCLFPHPCGRYACPLRYPKPTGQSCPINHQNWPKGGCITTLPLSPGTRARHELDRSTQAYKQVYKQRTATERVNSQAVELGIERPKLRNGKAIANLNTLIYVLINLRALHRIRQRKAK
jgi:hypothetical protein